MCHDILQKDFEEDWGEQERRGSVVVSMPAYHAAGQGSMPAVTRRDIIRCKNLALYIRDCVSLCLSEETL